MSNTRLVYVISDLHIGGEYPNPDAAHGERKRGFRMMTRVAELAGFIRHLSRLPADPPVELVINGDFLDFLAEEKGAGGTIDPTAPPQWTPFRGARNEAREAFYALARRDADLFAALGELLAKGKRLTIVLGNHDIEMSLPDVRVALEAAIGPLRPRILDDGQALDLGSVLVDHGNLFDPANVVDHDGLRLVRALHSRGQYEGTSELFKPPAGSRLVAEVMNPIKLAYGFVDLLKPESEPLIALLLALEPGYGSELSDAARALASAAKTLVPRRGVAFAMRNVSRGESDASAQLTDVARGGAVDSAAIDRLLAETLAADAAAAVELRASAAGGTPAMSEVAAGKWRARWSLLRLLRSGEAGLEARIPLVHATLRVLAADGSFSRTVESERYLDAAKWLATRGPDSKGYRAIVFGHTHHAKDMPIPDSTARYLNTGTWANLMRFPAVLTSTTATTEEVRAELLAFAQRLETNDLARDLVFQPTYVRLDLDGEGKMQRACLGEYDWKNDKLSE